MTQSCRRLRSSLPISLCGKTLEKTNSGKREWRWDTNLAVLFERLLVEWALAYDRSTHFGIAVLVGGAECRRFDYAVELRKDKFNRTPD